MKKIILIVAITLGVCILVLGVIALINTSSVGESSERILKYDNYTELDEINIDSTSSDINIHKSTNEQIKVIVKENSKISYTISFEEGILKIKENEMWQLFNFILIDKTIDIYIPYIKCDIDINCTSADINIERGFTFNKFDLKQTSGDFTMQDVIIDGEFKGAFTSGKIDISKITFNDLVDINHTSGKTMFENCGFKDVKINQTSGKLEMIDCKALNIDLDTTSGLVNISLLNNNINELNIESTSGNVNVTLPNTISGYKIKFINGSGKFYSNFDDNNPNYFGDGSIEINIKVVSGNFYLYKK